MLQEIKAAAKQGNQAGTRILAQQLVRLRGQITKMQVDWEGWVGVLWWGWVLVWCGGWQDEVTSCGRNWSNLSTGPARSG